MTTRATQDMFLTNRSAIVTGGQSGIGAAIARRLAEHGAHVSVGSRRTVPHQAAFADLQTHIHPAPLDVTDVDSIAQFVAASEQAIGPPDILVNAAGMTAEQGVVGHSDALWAQILQTNLTGAFQMTRAVLPGMIAQNWGRIINIGSTAASVGWKDNPAYCASKAGLLGLTRCVALEGAPHSVGCTMISPTWVETDLMHDNTNQIALREGLGRTGDDIMSEIIASNPQNRMIQANEVAATALFLCQDDALGLSMDDIKITGGALW
ncbi:MAG: SDR family NAD(P)-dependent oxidoreductase [Sedimentitalea sp.]